MDGLVALICYYLWGTAIVVGAGIVIQLCRNSRRRKQQAASQDKGVEDWPE